eukprot:2489326-Amphidinium_carterae.1
MAKNSSNNIVMTLRKLWERKTDKPVPSNKAGTMSRNKSTAETADLDTYELKKMAAYSSRMRSRASSELIPMLDHTTCQSRRRVLLARQVGPTDITSCSVCALWQEPILLTRRRCKVSTFGNLEE